MAPSPPRLFRRGGGGGGVKSHIQSPPSTTATLLHRRLHFRRKRVERTTTAAAAAAKTKEDDEGPTNNRDYEGYGEGDKNGLPLVNVGDDEFLSTTDSHGNVHVMRRRRRRRTRRRHDDDAAEARRPSRLSTMMTTTTTTTVTSITHSAWSSTKAVSRPGGGGRTTDDGNGVDGEGVAPAPSDEVSDDDDGDDELGARRTLIPPERNFPCGPSSWWGWTTTTDADDGGGGSSSSVVDIWQHTAYCCPPPPPPPPLPPERDVFRSSSSSSPASEEHVDALGDDPTVQESIECVFSHQLDEGGLANFFSWEDGTDDDENDNDNGGADYGNLKSYDGRSGIGGPRRTRRFDSGSLVHVGTYDPGPSAVLTANMAPSASRPPSSLRREAIDGGALRRRPRCASCRAGKAAPCLPPDRWPQAPLLLRPTPNSGTRVRGVRFSGSTEYLWQSGNDDDNGGASAGCDGDARTCWWDRLREAWEKDGVCESRDDGPSDAASKREPPPGCPECTILPINNGNEPRGRTLVIDFESPLFVGTLLLRIRHSSGTTPDPYDDHRGYFAGMNRRYQAVVQGRFKRPGIPMTECVTGQTLDRPCGRLPPKWMLRGAVKVVSFFAPQLKTNFEGPRPAFVSPLGSTPQSIVAHPGEDCFGDHLGGGLDLEMAQEEPADADRSFLAHLLPDHGPAVAPSSVARAKVRKKAFDKLYASRSKTPTFCTDTVYTFEFLQHLVNFADLTVELGSVLGRLRLRDLLDGQPLRMMSAHRRGNDGGGGEVHSSDLDFFWSFDLWHETLYDAAVRHDQ